MFSEQLKKVLDLAKKTGDKVIIVNNDSADEAYVIMGLESYTALVKSSPEEAVKKAVPAVENLPVEEPENTPINVDLSSDSEEVENLTEEDLTDKINREISMWKNREDSVYLGEEDKPKKVWQISPKVKDKAQEVE